MPRRFLPSFVFLILFASTAWPKLKPEDQGYFDEKFQALLGEVKALSKQVETLSVKLAEVRQTQAQAQEMLTRQERALSDLQQLVSTVRAGSAENFTMLKAALGQMRAETEKSLGALVGRSTDIALSASPPGSQPIQAYVTTVAGNEVVIDQGSAQGLHVGSRLALYKANEPGMRAGVLEVTQVVDAANSRARIVSTNAGARPEFGDIVRVE